MRLVMTTIFLSAIFAAAANADMSKPHRHAHGPTHPQAMAATEPGQGAFAALAEIVRMLRADPTTDWRFVNIRALRQHLVDMNKLILETEVVETDVAGGLEMRINLTGPGGDAARRMTPAHAVALAADTGWRSTHVIEASTLIWTVAAPDAAAQIRALGFYGLMAVGDHHQRHHVAIAKGQTPHRH